MTVNLPVDPRTMPDGVVLILNIRYENQTSDKVWPYAALKARGRWFLTGGDSPTDAGWGAVESWLRRSGRKLVSVEVQTGTKTIWPEPVGIVVQDQVDPGTQDEGYYGDDSPGPKIDTPQA